ncbi:hypothetical protein ACSAZK_15785 [Methanosarcina sp. Mfa9]|uniref:hypothetical protein n=1 Tax=Methanosarcina sp. Mfa9 TaxID=3439063 RepID=UPI003F85E63F
MATYKQIQEWVKANYCCNVKTCWIAHAKEICNIPVKKAPNRYNENIRTNPCPPDKFDYIKEAFEHFDMIKD